MVWRSAPRSLRLRITAGALVVVLAAFAGAGVIVVETLEDEMTAQIDSTLESSTEFINRSLAQGKGLPASEGPRDLYVQFVNADGAVIGASQAARGLPALAASGRARGRAARVLTVDRARLGTLRVRTEPLATDRSVTLVVARPAGNVSDVRSSVERLLFIMGGALLAIVGIVVWIVVGRSLRPVEAMRQTVDEIDDRELHRRVTRPGTGDELDRLADTLNALLARLDDAVARERRLVADASHELRTPIAGVRAILETEPADTSAVLGARAEALMTLERLEDLVDQLLVLGAVNEGSVGAHSGPVDLDELVLAQARQLERTTNLRIDTMQVSGGQVLGRDTDLGRVIENLAANAARYAATTVAFAVRQADDTVELSVTDDGPGIAAPDRARVFERFTTLDDGRSRDRVGAGLGLSIAAAIVAVHGGSIAAEDAPGNGARFVVRLPAMARVGAMEPA